MLSKSSDGKVVLDHFMHDLTKCNPSTIVLYFAHEHFNNVYASRTMSTVNTFIDNIPPAENPDNWRHVLHQIGAGIGGANREASDTEPYQDSDSSNDNDDLLENMKHRILSNKKACEDKNDRSGGGKGDEAGSGGDGAGKKQRPVISPQVVHRWHFVQRQRALSAPSCAWRKGCGLQRKK